MEAPMDPTATGHLERRHPTTADGSKNQSNWIKVNNFITKYTSYWLFFFITQEWSSGTKWPSLPADTCTSYNSKPPVKAVKTRIANCCHKSHSHYRRCVLNVQRTTRYLVSLSCADQEIHFNLQIDHKWPNRTRYCNWPLSKSVYLWCNLMTPWRMTWSGLC